MITKQCRFKEDSNTDWMGGIYIEEGNKSYVICGCCGSVFEEDDIKTFEGFQLYPEWLDISEEIKGDSDF